MGPETEKVPTAGSPIDNNRVPMPVGFMPQECRITQAENGFILKIGCKIFVAKTWDEASIGLGKYWEDPEAAQKGYTTKRG